MLNREIFHLHVCASSKNWRNELQDIYVEAPNKRLVRKLSDKSHLRASGDVMAYANEYSALTTTNGQRNGCGSILHAR